MTIWDLSDLADEKSIEENIQTRLDEALAFQAKFHNIFDIPFSEDIFIAALEEYEELLERAVKILNYGSLKHETHLDDEKTGKMYQKLSDMYAQISATLVFFSNGLTRMDHSISHPRYGYWLKEIQKYKQHTLDDSTEAYATQKDMTSHQAWIRLYDETLSQLPFALNGKESTLEEVVSQMSESDAKAREAAARILSTALDTQKTTFVRVMNSLLQDHKIDIQIRKYENPDDPKHLSNQIEKEVVDLLCATVKENYKNTSHRYYKLKAKLLGKEKLEYWDRNAPLFKDDMKTIPYEEGQAIVKKAYAAFSPTLAELVQRFYDNPWIDVYPRKGKTSGAFSASTVPSAHPYVLLNYQGSVRDVATLAHELGHGAHQVLSGPQGLFLSDTPLTIAETASVFGEMLTFESMKSMNPKALLSSKIDDMLNTVVRQIAFYEFEKAIHNRIKKEGELGYQEICDIFIETQREALGDGVNLDPIVGNFWMYIHHFFHSHFYVYAYAFGDCLVNSLYAQYKQTDDKAGFEQKYLEFLKAGGSKPYTEMLIPFNLDPHQKSFWEGGLKMIIDMIDELESLI